MTGRTKYEPYSTAGGYSEANVDEHIMVARFAGNAYTNKGDAAKLSNFRATEICYEKGYKALRIYDIKDLSSSQTVQKSSSYNVNRRSSPYFKIVKVDRDYDYTIEEVSMDLVVLKKKLSTFRSEKGKIDECER
ncbi:MAG: hypothetical protein IPK68_03990 [Bdellovibrionales bacterium]|nr:hypothetical protein [Bdellovibrionales bacterium]